MTWHATCPMTTAGVSLGCAQSAKGAGSAPRAVGTTARDPAANVANRTNRPHRTMTEFGAGGGGTCRLEVGRRLVEVLGELVPRRLATGRDVLAGGIRGLVALEDLAGDRDAVDLVGAVVD